MAARFGLSAAERRAFREDGFFARRGVFDSAEIESLRDAAERVRAVALRLAVEGRPYEVDGNRYVDAGAVTVQLEHRPGSPSLRVVEPFRALDPVFERLVDDARLVDPMRDLIGTARVGLWTDKLNFKPPHEGSGFRWHQDSPYWAHACRHLDQLPNVMLALDDADDGERLPARGARIAPPRAAARPPGRRRPRSPLHRSAPLRRRGAGGGAMPAGSLIFFSPHTVHGSEPNRSDRTRRAMVLTYQPGGTISSRRRAPARRSPVSGMSGGGSRMMARDTWIVTGGAGFIGCNFVRHALAGIRRAPRGAATCSPTPAASRT